MPRPHIEKPLGYQLCHCPDCRAERTTVNRNDMYEEMVETAAEAPVFGRDNPMLNIGLLDPTSPVTNPKEGAGASKPPVWSVMPRWVSLCVGRVMAIGAAKYDAFNYREAPVTSSTYEDAMERHTALWFDGEDNDAETGESHLASVIACATLLMDCQQTGMLVDNRQKTGLVRKSLDRLELAMKTTKLPPKNPNAPSLQRTH